MATYVERYRSGDYERVWSELLALGGGVRQEPMLSEALAVARETMMRARYNTEVLVQRLTDSGYTFTSPYHEDDPKECSPLARPPIQVATYSAELERRVGPIPLSLYAWFEIVGGVSLIGSYPGWPADIRPDPLTVDPVEQMLQITRPLTNATAAPTKTPPFRLIIAPDYDQKADISGGTYDIAAPDEAINARILGERHARTFVDYLRASFQWGGFLGLEWHKGSFEPDLAYLTKGLLPL